MSDHDGVEQVFTMVWRAQGPQQTAFFAAVLRRLSGQEGNATGEAGPDAPGDERSYPVGRIGVVRARAHDGYDALLQSGRVDGRELPAFEWCGFTPTTIGTPAHHAMVIADTGSYRDTIGIAVILRGAPKNNRVTWSALWLTPLWEPRVGRYRFRVIEGGRTIESRPFEVGASPPSDCDR